MALQLASEDSGYSLSREGNTLIVTLQYALDTNHSPADGRILVLDRFELDSLNKNLTGFRRSFEKNGSGTFWARAEKSLKQLQNKAVNSRHLHAFFEQVLSKIDLPHLSLQEQLDYHQAWLRAEPRNADAWESRAKVFMALKLPKEALASYESAIQLKAHPRFLLAHGNLAFQMKDYDKAFESYDQLKQMSAALPLAEEAEFRRNHGFLMKQMNNPKWAAESFEKALNCYDRLISEEADNPFVHRRRAEVLDELHKPVDALQAYIKVLQFDPDSAKASRRVAELHFELGDYTNAAVAYDDAIQNDFENSDLHVDYGIALYHIGLFKEAVVAYDNALALDGFNYRALYMRAKAFQALGIIYQYDLDWMRAQELEAKLGSQ